MESYRENLHLKIFTLPARFEDQMHLLRYLHSLDGEGAGDPASDCLVNEKRWYTITLKFSLEICISYFDLYACIFNLYPDKFINSISELR